MDGPEEKVLGYTSNSNLQSPAETSAGWLLPVSQWGSWGNQEGTTASVAPELHPLPIFRDQETTSRARLSLLGLPGQKWIPHFLLLCTQEAGDGALGLLLMVEQKSSFGPVLHDHVARKQQVKQTTLSSYILRRCI